MIWTVEAEFRQQVVGLLQAVQESARAASLEVEGPGERVAARDLQKRVLVGLDWH